MEKQPFYDFGTKMASRTLQVSGIELNKNYDPDKLILGDYEGISFPVVFKKYSGNRLDDILHTGSAGFYIISDRMKEVLTAHKLTGWQTFPIQIFDKQGNEIVGYHGFSTLGRSGLRDYRQSEVIEKRRFSDGPLVKYYKGYQIDINSWEGSDFFIPQNTRGILVTERAAEVLNKAKLTNVVIKNIADEEIHHFMIEDSIKAGRVLG